jgi:hypothetical protein
MLVDQRGTFAIVPYPRHQVLKSGATVRRQLVTRMPQIVNMEASGPDRFHHTKWIFYPATCYTWLGDDESAEEHARELIAYHTQPDGSSNAPMRTAMSHIDLGLIHARHGDLDEAVHHGVTAFSYDRKTEASLLSHAADLDQLLSDRYSDEHHADDFHQRYQEARTALRRKSPRG